MKRFALLFALLPMTMSAAVSGEWRALVTATNVQTHSKQKIGIYATLSQNGSTLTGTAGTQNDAVPIQNGTVSGNTLTFSIPEGNGPSGPQRLTQFNLTVSGTNLVGTVTLFDGEVLSVTMTPVK